MHLPSKWDPNSLLWHFPKLKRYWAEVVGTLTGLYGTHLPTEHLIICIMPWVSLMLYGHIGWIVCFYLFLEVGSRLCVIHNLHRKSLIMYCNVLVFSLFTFLNIFFLPLKPAVSELLTMKNIFKKSD